MDQRQKLLYGVRKYLSLSQAQMAREFNFSQSKIARAELGKSPFWDHEWRAFAQKICAQEDQDLVYLPSQDSLDFLHKKIHHRPKPSFSPSITMRSTVSTFNFLRSELGKEKELNDLLNDFPLFKYYEQFHDLKINPIYLHQMTEAILDNGLAEGPDLETVGSSFTKRGLTPEIYEGFQAQRAPLDKIKYAMSINHKYFDFTYYTYKETKDKLQIGFHFNVPRAFMLKNVCAYQHSYLQTCSSFGLDRTYLNLKKDRCYFEGDRHCRFIASIS